MASFVEKFKGFWSPSDSDYDSYDEYEYDYDDEENVDDPRDAEDDDRNIYSRKQRQPTRRGGRESSRSGGFDSDEPYNTNKVVNINATARLQVVLFKPERFGEETRDIADELIKTHTVVLNLEDSNKDMQRRIIDFLSGVAYANNGKIRKIASNTFIIIPSNVDLTGDNLLDELESNGVIFG